MRWISREGSETEKESLYYERRAAHFLSKKILKVDLKLIVVLQSSLFRSSNSFWKFAHDSGKSLFFVKNVFLRLGKNRSSNLMEIVNRFLIVRWWELAGWRWRRNRRKRRLWTEERAGLSARIWASLSESGCDTLGWMKTAPPTPPATPPPASKLTHPNEPPQNGITWKGLVECQLECSSHVNQHLRCVVLRYQWFYSARPDFLHRLSILNLM